MNKIPFLTSFLFITATTLLLLFYSPGVQHAVSAAQDDGQWQKASLDGVEIYYQDSGNRDGIPLVFIHGWSGNSSLWHYQTSAFAKDFRVIVLDLPGFGRSGKPHNVDYTMDYFARAVKSVIDQAGVKNPVLIGHSMGYAVVRQYLTDFPDTVRAIVNVDGAFLRVPESQAGRDALNSQIESWLKTFDNPDRPQAVKQFLESTFYGKTPEKLREEIIAVAVAADTYAADSSMREMLNLEQWKDRQFNVPALMLYAQSEHITPDHEAYMRTLFPKMVYKMWNDTGHFLMMEQPERFNAELLDFLRNLPN